MARCACIPLSLIGAYITYRWCGAFYGLRPALVALVLWCFSPSLLGNGAMVTPDVAATSFGLAASFFFWHWLSNKTYGRAVVASIALAAAVLSKTTWLLLFGLWPVLWLLDSIATDDTPGVPGVRLQSLS